jgi:hypothetical protein
VRACTLVSEIGSVNTTPRGTYTNALARAPASFSATNASSSGDTSDPRWRSISSRCSGASSVETITPSGSSVAAGNTHSGCPPAVSPPPTRS